MDDLIKEVDPVLVLLKPVEVEGVPYGSLTLRELTVGEIMAFNTKHGKKSGLDHDVPYFALMCGVPELVIKSLGQRDFKALNIRHADFLDVGNDSDQDE